MHYLSSPLALRRARGAGLAAGCSSSNGAMPGDASTTPNDIADATSAPDVPPADTGAPDVTRDVPAADTATPDVPPSDTGAPDVMRDAGPQSPDVPSTPTTGRLAYVAEGAEHHPAVWVQNADGSMRRQLHFERITDTIPEQDDRVPRVTDTGVLAIHYLAWSPSGGQVAAVVTTAIDQSEVVVLDVESGGGFIASANGQYVMPALDWSADGRSLAFVMSTTAHAGALELVAADTVAHTWRFLTHNANLRGMSVRTRFNADGTSVAYSRINSEEPTSPWNSRSSLHSIRLDTLASSVLAPDLVGRIDGITRDFSTAILHRTTRAETDGTREYGLFARAVTGTTETVLVDRATVTMAAQGPRDGALLVFDASPDGTSGVYRVSLPDRTDARVDLPGGADRVALWWPAP